MKCRCGNNEPYLIEGRCSVCRKANPEPVKKRYIVEVCKGWYYDGSVSRVRIPAKKGRGRAKVFQHRKAAINRAVEFGGKIEEI